ncbi:MAG: hypothetical protein KAZ30_01200 [Candidatus Magasanikbacteria bacterium]|nr:hypothetical protein [Candidatus Magasanikbacteria bacterium]
MPPDFHNLFAELKGAVLAKKLVLKDILEKHGSKSLTNYAQDYFEVNEGPHFTARQEEFLSSFEPEVARLLGVEVAKSAANQLRKYFFASTADHHGPICNPYFLGSNLVTAITGLAQNDSVFKHVIVLSCGTVSVDNDTFPRGLTLTGTNSMGELETLRLPFFSSHERPALICLLRAYGQTEITKIRNVAKDLARAGSITQETYYKINALITEIYDTPENLALASYSDQITTTNYQLWEKFFPATVEHPGLIYLELERFVTRLLLDHHLNKDTILHTLFFTEQGAELLMKNFDGIIGAFSTQDNSGTYLFWAVPKGERYRVRLMKKDGRLVSEDGSYSVPLTPEGIAHALEVKEIVPGMMVDFIILACYYGLKCLGGFSQVNYLTEFKYAYLKVMAELGETEELGMVEVLQTKELGEDMTIAYVGGAKGRTALATGIDVALHLAPDTFEILKQEASQITLDQALDPMYPLFYKVIYPDWERKESLLSVTAHDITHNTGIEEKIMPCVKLPESNNDIVSQN